MKTFEGVRFNGKFRDYQQKILDNSAKHLRDKKIHIVAAPGSGKTILGLELIRRLSKPALILSPSVTIRQQWGERFTSGYLPKDTNGDEYISFDLKKPKLLTSITYQALSAAYNRTVCEIEADDEITQTETPADYTDFDLFATVKQAGIETICLDEAHHLRSEWQKALEGFISKMGTGVTVISLTATPPYDSTPSQWNRYSTLCGEIDEEIFVPQLVAQKTLCPHQDYIYFNYPAKEEIDALNEYRQKAIVATQALVRNGVFSHSVKNCGILPYSEKSEEIILENPEEFKALFSCASFEGENLPSNIVKLVYPKGKISKFTLENAQTALQFICDNPQIFTEAFCESVSGELKKAGLTEKRKVCLVTNEKLDKLLISSIGKLESIQRIVESESEALDNNLRMLILTDFIKKDMLTVVGTDEKITTMGTVPVFECVRRICKSDMNIAVLSGTLVILPDRILNDIKSICDNMNVNISTKPLSSTGYSEVSMSGSNKNKVAVITEAQRLGYIHILIGTKALLGEGWDSPCINSLILASFVGSFMLSNQMRGRAIRIDRNAPDKCSNIWHLVTVEPPFLSKTEDEFAVKENNCNEISGSDYQTVARRFNCFLAPSYSTGKIESGIKRIDIIKPPFTKEGIENINQKTVALAQNRKAMADSWNNFFKGSARFEIVQENEIPAAAQAKGAMLTNLWSLILLLVLLSVLILGFGILSDIVPSGFVTFLAVVSYIVISIFIVAGFAKLMKHISPTRSIKTMANALLKALKKIGEIESNNARVFVSANKYDLNILCSLQNATEREKNVFAKALSEMLSPIDNPRYVIIRKSKLGTRKYIQSYACPSVVASKKETAEIFSHYLSKAAGKFELVYTRNEEGNKALLKCRKHSYINANAKLVRNIKSAKRK